ncbi:MAG: hypothetical protein B6229_03590 [Spirochaetaceae bacterium 4572_7]|nr:MAG: hypothetical protein B6229_03590 [Spirochaetaceae bacterium 4572_7]
MEYMNTKRYTKNKLLLIIIVVVLLSSCTTTTNIQNSKKSFVLPAKNQPLTKKQQVIITSALNACNKNYTKYLSFNNRSFNNDCSGLIYGIFWESGLNLLPEVAKETGGGVLRLHKVLDRHNLIHTNKLPNPGDLIFWDNTYGKWGQKPLSHIGVVVSVKSDGTIEYVHNNTYLGAIRKERMNLYKPHENRPTNNYMRYDSKYKKTAAELFNSFGMAWQL